MYDDILYIDKQRRPFLSREEIIEYCRIKMDVDFLYIHNDNYFKIFGDFVLNIIPDQSEQFVHENLEFFRHAFHHIYIKTPLPEKINCVTKIKIIEKEVIREKPLEIFKCIEFEDIEKCNICYDKTAFLSFGCCSIKYCGNCVAQLHDKPCSQCRRIVNISNLMKCVK